MPAARHARSRRIAIAAGAGSLALVLVACNSDGRTLRPARADQGASVSTLAPPTTVDPGLIDGGGVLDDGIDEAASTFETLPVAQTAAPMDTSDLPAVTGGAGSADVPVEAVLSGPWEQDEPIDAVYTCDGSNVSPPLTWSPAPANTAEIALTMTDTDAPGFVHWAIAGLPPTATAINEGEVPAGAIVATNSGGGSGYTGPCPPSGAPHHYVITVHFLAQQTELSSGVAGADLVAAVDDATFNGASLVGTYQRP